MTRPRVRLGDLSVGFVQPLGEALQQLGHDPAPLLRRYGLDHPRLAEAGARLSIPRYMHLGHAAIELCGEPALGLHMGRLSRLAQAGLAGVTAAQAPTLGEAARALLHFEPLYAANYRGQSSFQEDAHGAWLRFYSISPYNAYNRFVVDSLLAGWLAQLALGRPLGAGRAHGDRIPGAQLCGPIPGVERNPGAVWRIQQPIAHGPRHPGFAQPPALP